MFKRVAGGSVGIRMRPDLSLSSSESRLIRLHNL